MRHRRQSFSLILSVPLPLSKSPCHARESVGRRRSPSIITNGAAPANPSLREQAYSRPAVGFSVRGHRPRAQGRRKSLPATTCQRNARASCYGVRSQFGPRGRDTYLARLQRQHCVWPLPRCGTACARSDSSGQYFSNQPSSSYFLAQSLEQRIVAFAEHPDARPAIDLYDGRGGIMAPAAYPLAHRQRAGDLESPPFSLQLFAGHLHSRRDLAARFFCVPQGDEFGVADHAINGGGCHEDNPFSIPVVCELLEGDSCPRYEGHRVCTHSWA